MAKPHCTGCWETESSFSAATLPQKNRYQGCLSRPAQHIPRPLHGPQDRLPTSRLQCSPASMSVPLPGSLPALFSPVLPILQVGLMPTPGAQRGLVLTPG